MDHRALPTPPTLADETSFLAVTEKSSRRKGRYASELRDDWSMLKTHSALDAPFWSPEPNSFKLPSHQENLITHVPNHYSSDHLQNPFTPEKTPQPCPVDRDSQKPKRRGGNRRTTSKATKAKTTSAPTKTGRSKPCQRAALHLDAPLSELAKLDPEVEVLDVEAFAARDTGDRQGSACRAGRVKRPLNAFMLYRKAYQKVALKVMNQENQDNQIVSRICGYSWSQLEPDMIREKFKALANTETKKHKEAHPEYKYVPKKCATDEEEPSVYPYPIEMEHFPQNSSHYPSPSEERAGPPSPSRSATPAMTGSVEHQSFNSQYGYIPSRQSTPSWNNVPSFADQAPQAQFPMVATHTYGAMQYPSNPFTLETPQQSSMHLHVDDSLSRNPIPTTEGREGFADLGGGYIDPRLFTENGSNPPHNEHIQLGGYAEPSSLSSMTNPYMTSNPNNGLVVSGLDEFEAQDAYLRGSSSDWHVEKLCFPAGGDIFLQSEEWLNRTDSTFV